MLKYLTALMGLTILSVLLQKYKDPVIETYTLSQFLNRKSGTKTTNNALIDKLLLGSHYYTMNTDDEGSDAIDIGDIGDGDGGE
jgi:hypothetical protein